MSDTRSADLLAEYLRKYSDILGNHADELAEILDKFSGIDVPADTTKTLTLRTNVEEAAEKVTTLTTELRAQQPALADKLKNIDAKLESVCSTPVRCEQQGDAQAAGEGGVEREKKDLQQQVAECDVRLGRADRLTRGFAQALVVFAEGRIASPAPPSAPAQPSDTGRADEVAELLRKYSDILGNTADELAGLLAKFSGIDVPADTTKAFTLRKTFEEAAKKVTTDLQAQQAALAGIDANPQRVSSTPVRCEQEGDAQAAREGAWQREQRDLQQRAGEIGVRRARADRLTRGFAQALAVLAEA